MIKYLILLLFSLPVILHAQVYDWGHVIGKWGTKIAATTDSTMTYLGSFEDTVTLHGNEENILLENDGVGSYIATFDAQGNVVHAFSLHGFVTAFDIDSEQNLYVAGQFTDTLHFNSAFIDTILVSNGLYVNYFAKYNSTGELLWVTSTGAEGEPVEVAIDNNGNMYVASNRNGTYVSLNESTWEMEYFPTKFVVLNKISVEGESDWQLKTTDGNLYAECVITTTGIEIDTEGNLYLIANGAGYINFFLSGDPETIAIEDYSAIIMKLTSEGSIIWTHILSSNDESEIFDITSSPNNNLFTVVGKFHNSLDLPSDFTDIELNGYGQTTRFIAHFDTAGLFSHAFMIGAESPYFEWYNYNHSIALDNNNNIFIAGLLTTSTDLDPGPDTFEPGQNFIAKYNEDGDFLWAGNTGDHDIDFGGKLATDSEGSVYLCGRLGNPVEFSPGNPSSLLQPEGEYSGYLVKFSVDVLLNNAITFKEINMSIRIYPNPAVTHLNIMINNAGQTNTMSTLTDINGKFLKSTLLRNGHNSIDLTPYPTGIYLLSTGNRTHRVTKL